MLNFHEQTLIEELKRYLTVTLHTKIRINTLKCPSNLPTFISIMYNFYEIWIQEIHCIVLIPKNLSIATPAQITQHVELVRRSLNTIVILATSSIDAFNRARLIIHRVAFVVPGNQLYIPELAADLREHFRALQKPAANSLTPAAQAVLFHYLLHGRAETPSILAKALHYSAMSIGRAFQNLVVFELAHVKTQGKERHICFNPNRHELFIKSLGLLRNPIRSIKYIQKGFSPTLKFAGESALSQLTDVSPPQKEVFAIAANQWKIWKQERKIVEIEKQVADVVVETWSYDPEGLSETLTVDPLSLYIQFKDHQNERLAIAAESLLEKLPW